MAIPVVLYSKFRVVKKPVFSSLEALGYYNDNPGATRDDKAPDRFKWIHVYIVYLTSYWDQSL